MMFATIAIGCAHCGAACDNRAGREVVGIERPRAGGGLHSLIGRRETGRWVCADCIRKIRNGAEPGQLELGI